MNKPNKKNDAYNGFEQGPIRPPSEAKSLLLRVTRNCPWNQCTFCPLYKKARFSIRPVEHVKHDIDLIYKYIEALKEISHSSKRIYQFRINGFLKNMDLNERQPFYAALNWYNNGMRSVFLQDANTLIIKPSDLVEILLHLKKLFPMVERITSYSRSHTITKISDVDLKLIKDAGLNRIHIGLESGSDNVLRFIKKGATKKIHIEAGLKVKRAGIELSEYYMPGIGGRKWSNENACETADTLNQINADFIRIRTLAIPIQAPLFIDYKAGRFEKCTDLEMAEEILLFIENLDGITSTIKSDHILNLFGEVEGTLPHEKERMIDILHTFLSMPSHEQCLYQVGRRLGLFYRLKDLENHSKHKKVEKICLELGITPNNVDKFLDEQMQRFI
ncbi:MAG: radical SAM protein [Desulfobacterales bacterium]|nr:radical SAM protein [Desulfobacterales bacterium]